MWAGIIALAVLIGIILLFRAQKNQGSASSTLQIGSRAYAVEIADTMMNQAQGLSGRPSLAEGAGMLFVFKSATNQAFWMHGMEFPLDFVWISGGKVIGTTENVPADSKSIYAPPAPADRVLEVNAGTVAKDGIKVGDVVELK